MADPITYADFAKLELRVAKVLEARPHPNADRLLLLQVDVGDEQKQIVAGIRQHYYAGAARREADRDRQQPRARDAARRVVERHAAGRHFGREGGRADGRRPGLRGGGEDQVTTHRRQTNVRRGFGCDATLAISRLRRSWRPRFWSAWGRSAGAGRACSSQPAGRATSSPALLASDASPRDPGHRDPGRPLRGRAATW